jgi:hypothetical protein
MPNPIVFISIICLAPKCDPDALATKLGVKASTRYESTPASRALSSDQRTSNVDLSIMDNFASEEEKLVKNEIVKDEIVQKSGKTGLIIGITVL